MEKNVRREWTESATDPLNSNPSHWGNSTFVRVAVSTSGTARAISKVFTYQIKGWKKMSTESGQRVPLILLIGILVIWVL